MKCPNCNAEVTGNFCEFCGSEMPKEQPVVITNNYYGTDEDGQEETGTIKCPKCGSSKIEFSREQVDTYSEAKKNSYSTQTSYRTVALCQGCGYTWNPNSSSEPPKTSGSNIGIGKVLLMILFWQSHYRCCFIRRKK